MKKPFSRLINRLYCATALLLLATPSVYAGILSQGLCRPYRQLVDNELFLVVGLIVAAILVIAWKLAPSGSTLAKGVGLLAAIAIGLNLETLMQASFGTGVAC
jgi:hypothetical protein